MQVALLSGLDADAQKKLSSSKDSNHHLNKLLRILTVRTESGRDRSGIALVGGPHDPKADGSATQRYPPEPCLVLCKSTLSVAAVQGAPTMWPHLSVAVKAAASI